MLYHLHEMSHAAMTPLRMAAGTMGQVYRSPLFPGSGTGIGRALAAGCEVVERVTQRYDKPKFGFDEVDIGRERVPVREEVVFSLPFCDVLHFRRLTDRQDPRVLVVAPMSGHHATLLRGTVAAMLPDHDVYVTDWANARDVPLSRGGFDLEDFVDYLLTFFEELGPDLHVVAVCQPSVPALAACSVASTDTVFTRPLSMTLIGGPVDTRVAPTPVNMAIHDKPLSWFDHAVISRVPANRPGAWRRVYPGFLSLTGFMTMNLERHVGAHMDLFQHLVEGDGDGAAQHRAFYDEYMSVMDLPAEYYLQTLDQVFMKHARPEGLITWQGETVEPKAVEKTALMTVEGARDDITPPGQTQAAHRLCLNIPGTMRAHHLQDDVGHFGAFNGRRWREETYPRVRDFIRAHD